jgi:hypothetical protein
MQLHTINKEKPIKKCVGRKRKFVEDKSKKHHPIAPLQLMDDLGAGEGDLHGGRKKTLFLGLC